MTGCKNCGAPVHAGAPRGQCWRCGQRSLVREYGGPGVPGWAVAIGGLSLIVAGGFWVLGQEALAPARPEVTESSETVAVSAHAPAPMTDPDPPTRSPAPLPEPSEAAGTVRGVSGVRGDDPPSGNGPANNRQIPAKRKPPPQPPNVPSRLRFGSLTVSGRLSPNVVRGGLEQRRAALEACVPRNEAAAHGAATVRFVIGRDGNVSNVSNGGTSDLGSATTSCLLRAVYAVTLPKPEGGIVTVAARLMFDPR